MWGRMGREGRGGGDVVGPPGQSIGFAIAGTLAIDDVVVVGSEGGGPFGMASGCCPGLQEVFQILVVCVDLDRMCCPVNVDPLVSQCCHHCKLLFVVDRAVEFCCSEFS